MWNPFKAKPNHLSAMPRMTEMKIVCGDCGGDEIKPVETILMSDGFCAGCGGHSFVCAARLSMVLARHLQSTKEEAKNTL